MGSMRRESVTVVVIGSKETKYEWRRALVRGQFPLGKKLEVKQRLAVYLEKLNSSMPHILLLIWLSCPKGTII